MKMFTTHCVLGDILTLNILHLNETTGIKGEIICIFGSPNFFSVTGVVLEIFEIDVFLFFVNFMRKKKFEKKKVLKSMK